MQRLLIFSSIIITSIAASKSHNESYSCADFTLDVCTFQSGGRIEVVKDIGEEGCQNYCAIIYENQCDFFIYDRKQQVMIIIHLAT